MSEASDFVRNHPHVSGELHLDEEDISRMIDAPASIPKEAPYAMMTPIGWIIFGTYYTRKQRQRYLSSVSQMLGICVSEAKRLLPFRRLP